MKSFKLISVCVIIATVFLFNSCKPSEEQFLNKIAEMEKTLNADSTKVPEKAEAVKLIDLYADFAVKFPQSEQASECLFKAARYCMSYMLSTKAVEFFDNIIKNYPQYPKLPDCYFLKAFVYDSQLSNLPMARKTYEELIAKYPNHELSVQAKGLIDILGKNLEDVVAGFEEKNQTKETPVAKK